MFLLFAILFTIYCIITLLNNAIRKCDEVTSALNEDSKKLQSLRYFGFVTRDSSQLFDICWLFAATDSAQSSSIVIEFIKLLMTTCKTAS